MDNEISKQDSTTNPVGGAAQCGPACNCGATGLSTKGKAIICLVVAIVAGIFLVRGFARNAGSIATKGNGAFAATVPVSPSATEKAKSRETKQTKSAQWSDPLKDLASLNEVAAQKDAVFVYLPKKGEKPQEAVKRNIEQAAAKSESRGMAVSFYTLDTSSRDYAQVTAQLPAPCVLALVKNAGTGTVSGDISEKKLLEAIVSASRTSGCGPSGCGSSSSGCGSSGCN